MKYPNIVKSKTEYYILITWQDKTKMGSQVNNCYMTEKGAKKKAKALLSTGLYESIMIRKETVYKRDELTELSCSSPFVLYEKEA